MKPRPSSRDLETGWRQRGNCRDNPAPFDRVLHLAPNSHRRPAAVEAARAVCRPCVVAEACLAAALADPESEGVWAGTVAEQRVAMRRSAQRAERREKRRGVA